MARRGLRVLAVADGRFHGTVLPDDQRAFAFSPRGLVGFHDPVRPAVPAAIVECARAGIRVIMITGDYPETARSVAAAIGIGDAPVVVTGPEVTALDMNALRARVREAQVFARVVPQQKLLIVEALKANGEIVAMTGDGVNDAPALKSAHIGIAMGARGTDVAREAADLVLLDDDFSALAEAVRLGRRIFDNLRKAFAFLVAVHVPIVGMSFLPIVVGLPPLLAPVHIVFLEFLIDPACTVAFEAEPEEADVMTRPPRSPAAALLDLHTIAFSFVQGLGMLTVVGGAWGWTLMRGMGEGEARAVAFAALIVVDVALILVDRSWSRSLWQVLATRNDAAWWVALGALAALAAALYWAPLARIFAFTPLAPPALAVAALTAPVAFVWFGTLKMLHRRSLRRRLA
jgi:Ca2+-transporting ATPase